jgi:hypothetical protein
MLILNYKCLVLNELENNVFVNSETSKIFTSKKLRKDILMEDITTIFEQDLTKN